MCSSQLLGKANEILGSRCDTVVSNPGGGGGGGVRVLLIVISYWLSYHGLATKGSRGTPNHFLLGILL